MQTSLLLTFVLGLTAPAATQGVGNGNAQGRYIVVFHDGVDAADATADLLGKHGGAAAHSYGHALNGFAGAMGAAAAGAMAADPRVKWVEADGIGTTCVQETPTGVNRIDADLSSTVAGNGIGSVDVDIAILDTGSGPHADLNISEAVSFATGEKATADANGHGTHCAGIAAATDNGDGVVGVAPGARIWSVKVLNRRGSGSYSDIIKGIDFVTANAGSIEAANMSLGGSASDSLDAALIASVSAGVTYAVAAGNSGKDAKDYSPARVDVAITVSALADSNGLANGGGASMSGKGWKVDDDAIVSWSNYGVKIDIAAPGVNIKSTWKGGVYNTISGTSMASPHVAGAAALYKAGNPAKTPAEVAQALLSAGTFDYKAGWVDTQDGIKEPILNVGGF